MYAVGPGIGQKISKFYGFFANVALMVLLSSQAAFAEDLLSEGIAFYKAGQYPKAREYFESLVRKDPAYWPARYELGNTYMKLGELGLAKQQYEACLREKPDPKIAGVAEAAIMFLDKHPQTQNQSTSTSPTTSTTATDTTTPSTPQVPFNHRINIVPPQYDHPPVSESTINTVRGIIGNLPPHVYETLDTGGAEVNVAPNITDKWPEMLKSKLDEQGLHLAQDAARCYGKEVYIYERQLIPGTTRVGDIAFDSESVTNVLKHELGHALDDCMGVFTKSDEMLAVYNRDLSAMSDDLKNRLWYYTKPGWTGAREAYAETFAGILGAQGKDTEQVRNGFPLLREWVRNKLKL
jgi:hypothetical protein